MSDKTPTHFLRKIIGNPVKVKLSNSSEFTGRLEALDGSLNLALREARESADPSRRFPTLFIRGNNGNISSVLYITPE